MRILIKGGVWKNTEDEILKAAVMKYGKCQWSRVSSLLTRKSAKQCKARWYEWLDPSIKKTEWNREEEEKLLHLAKLMPNQWRTIAPIVGRTAGQCMEHYEKLLDQAQEQAMKESSSSSGAVADDARRLRPGEIDPHPESKPARPDPIDMDDDEKEMLSEARARLANTKGKKAKRKARERQLEEARRLSMLQKRRELKAAGVDMKLTGVKKRKYIDFAKEVPFQKPVPAGFYDVGEENVLSRAATSHIDPKQQGLKLAELEGRHAKEEEERERARDKKRLKTLFKANAPLVVLNISKMNDPTTIRKRIGLALPAPQVSESELEEIVKAGQNLMLPPEGRPGKAGVPTLALLGDYSSSFGSSSSARQLPTRTPMQEDIVMQEARNQRAMRDVTCLMDADTPLPVLFEGTGFQGMDPRSAKLATPNAVLSTPSLGGTGGMGSTPMIMGHSDGVLMASSASVPPAAGFGRTPLRDQFGLNAGHDSDNFSVSDAASVSGQSMVSSRYERERERFHRAELKSQLRALPEPEFTYEIALPAVGDDEDDLTPAQRALRAQPMDAAEAEYQQRAARDEEVRLELSRRSTVMKRDLPRPAFVTPAAAEALARPSLDPTQSTPEQLMASGMVGEEMVRLVRNDEYKYPMSGGGAGSRGRRGAAPTELDVIDDQELEAARELIEHETDVMLSGGVGMGQGMGSDRDTVFQQLAVEYGTVWEECTKLRMFLPSRGENGAYGVPENKTEMLTSLATQFAAIRARVDKDSKTAQKLESKLQVTTQGYMLRAKKLEQAILGLFDQCGVCERELVCFKRLHEAERKDLSERVAKAQQDAAEAEQAEAILQARYARLSQKVQSFTASAKR